jgi:hypothetical protein
MSKAQAAISNRKSSCPAAALVMTTSSLTFQLHPKQLVAFRSKATEIPYRGPLARKSNIQIAEKATGFGLPQRPFSLHGRSKREDGLVKPRYRHFRAEH